MSNIKPITIKDGATSPANVTFSPVRTQQSVGKSITPAEWRATLGDSLIGSKRITISVEPAYAGVSKVRIVVADPVIIEPSTACCTDGLPQVAYTDFANIQFNMPATATTQNRKDILAYAKNLLAQDVVTEAVVNLEYAY